MTYEKNLYKSFDSFYSNYVAQFTQYLQNLSLYVSLWISIYLLLCLIMYHLCTRKQRHYQKFRRTLLVIAHPDDECMFFGPTIFRLCESGINCHILCLSDGNYDGKGSIRWKELWHACNLLGIPDENICLVRDTRLLDDPKLQWPIPVIANLIQNTIETLDVEMLITFDKAGVSSHPNHTAVYYALAYLFIKKLMPQSCSVYTLDSVNLLRKYWNFLDLPLSFMLSSKRYILSWKESNYVVRAMKCHQSQMLWFRYLYLMCSRYVVINTLHEVHLSDIELELEIDD